MMLLAIFEGTGGAAEDNAAVVYGGKSGESGRWEDGPGGNEKPTFVDAGRDASRSENADGVSGNKIGYASIDKEAGIINEGGYPTGGGTTTGMVSDSKGERILNGEKSRPKADGVQETQRYLPACNQWPCGQRAPLDRREERGRHKHTETNGATRGRTHPDRSR